MCRKNVVKAPNECAREHQEENDSQVRMEIDIRLKCDLMTKNHRITKLRESEEITDHREIKCRRFILSALDFRIKTISPAICCDFMSSPSDDYGTRPGNARQTKWNDWNKLKIQMFVMLIFPFLSSSTQQCAEFFLLYQKSSH